MNLKAEKKPCWSPLAAMPCCENQSGTVEEQFENLRIPIRQIARLSREYKTIITHGMRHSGKPPSPAGVLQRGAPLAS